MTETPERLREALVDLDRARVREKELRLETEALLAGLQALSLCETTDVLFREILKVFQVAVSCQDVVLLEPVQDGLWVGRASTRDDLARSVWRPQGLFRRVLEGQPAAVFDVGEIPEWREQPEALRRETRSALHIAIGRGERLALVVCTHPDRGYFTRKHLVTATRFVPLASEALVHVSLRSSLEERDRFFTLSPELMCIVGRDGRFRQANQSWETVLGFTQEELLGKPFLSLVHPEERSAVEVALAALAGCPGHTASFESRCARRDGGYRWLAWRVATDPNRGPHYAVARDVTERRAAEEERAKSLALLRTTLDASTDGILVVGREGMIVTSNKTFAEMWRIPPEVMDSLTSERALEFVVHQLRDPEGFLARVRELYADPEAESLDLVDFADGRLFERYSRPHRMGQAIVGRVWTFRDVTERRRDEEALRLRDRAIETISQGLVIADATRADAPILYVNPGFEHITGYSADEALGRNPRFLQGPETDAATRQQIAEAIVGGEPVSVEVLNYCKDGTPFWNELSITPIRDPSGRLTHFVGVITNATDRKNLEEQLRQAQKMEAIGRLSGGIAHDFNNILSVILGYSDLLLRQIGRDDSAWRKVVEIQKAGARAASLTQQLLAFSRQQIIRPKILSLNLVVRDMERMVRRLIGEDIALQTLTPEGLGHVEADPGQLEQVILNLALNARDAMPNGGTLSIETANVELDEAYASRHKGAKPGQYVMLAVSDTGVGMDAETRRRVFEPFFTTKEKGTGLGLATVYGIVKQSGGNVWVYSELQCGTTFKVYLPRVDEAAAAAATVAAGDLQGGSETILVVEDEEALREVVRELFEGLGYTVITASSGPDALAAVADHEGPIDLVLTDVVMPGMSGRDLAAHLKRLRPDAKIVFMSGYTNDTVLRHGVMVDGEAFIQKPFTPETLARTVRQVLSQEAP